MSPEEWTRVTINVELTGGWHAVLVTRRFGDFLALVRFLHPWTRRMRYARLDIGKQRFIDPTPTRVRAEELQAIMKEGLIE